VITDNTLLEARNRIPGAFREIYMEFSDFVWTVALKTSGNTVTAEDITSEVFIKLFKKIDKFHFQSSFKSWLYRVTVNTALNYIKKEKRHRVGKLVEDLTDSVNDDNNIEDSLSDRDLAQRLLNNLDVKHRIMIVLRDIEGLSYEEIADALKMNLGTVKTKIYRAREQLRAAYIKEGGGIYVM